MCNSGTSLVPTIDGTAHHFEAVGVYDALFVLQDVESKTLWNHITGEALYGPHVGHSLGPMGNVLQMTVEQALAMAPEIDVAISDRPYLSGPSDDAGRNGELAPENKDAQLRPSLVETLATEDDRLPRMPMGLGVVTDSTVRFYPMDLIEERGALLDTVDGRGVLVFMDPATYTPAAFFTNASTASLQDRDIHLEGGRVVKLGVLHGRDGTRVDTERPQQLFSRWYGFALTFPEPDIFGP